ncbi:MAG: flagellar hook-length control protein FliK [Demequina sp.]
MLPSAQTEPGHAGGAVQADSPVQSGTEAPDQGPVDATGPPVGLGATAASVTTTSVTTTSVTTASAAAALVEGAVRAHAGPQGTTAVQTGSAAMALADLEPGTSADDGAGPVTALHGRAQSAAESTDSAMARAASGTAGSASRVSTGPDGAGLESKELNTTAATPASATAGAATPAAGSAAPAAQSTPASPALAPQLAPQFAHLRQLPHGEHVLTVTVNPEHFGPVKVVVHITADGASVQLLSPTEAGREALRAALADLRRDLAATGMDAELELGATHDDAHERQDARPGDGGSRLDSRNRVTLPEALVPATTSTTATGPIGSQGVDLYL